MKKISVLLALFTLAFTELVFAGAVVTSTTGTVQVQTGTAPARTLRLGDQVNQGDTVSTVGASSVVLKFDDGQVAALSQNSRMTVTAYQYSPQARSGNILLSLVNGGMRAITGLLGRANPSAVSYRAATATIGIRGTDTTIGTDGTNVVVTVAEGSITFSFGGQTVTVNAGQGAFGANGQITPGAAAQILNQLPASLQTAIGGITGLTSAINAAGAGIPPQGDTGSGTGTGSTPSGSTGNTGGGGGGGTASPS